MRLKLFENKQEGIIPRSVPIHYSDAISAIKKECKSAYASAQKGSFLFRGMNFKNDDALFIQPSKGNRVSINTINLYTVLIDNSPLWKGYPKRSKSVICSNSYSYASTFGQVFLVFPKDGYKIGVCPDMDIWNSFRGIGNLETFNATFKFLIQDLYIKVDWNNFNTINDLKKLCDTVDRLYKDGIEGVKKPLFMRGYDGDLLKYLEKLFDPDANHFKLTNNYHNIPIEREIWTDSDCYLISWKAARSEGIA